MNRKRRVWIVQQGVWKMRLESMPLAAGYLKAYADDDAGIRADCDIRIFSFDGGDTTLRMVERLFFEEVPDIVCFSVLGWNYNKFRKCAETFKQFNRDGWVIFGGNHVSQQARRVFAEAPSVDIVVNGEGEITFREILAKYLADSSRHELDSIDGVSFRRPDGELVTTPPRERIRDLDVLPSPVLSGAIPMLDVNGAFRYDVAIMETNRGCPYKCAFCYWGGAIGQKVRTFSRERVRAELEVYGQLKVDNVILCDANFGMLKTDRDFIEDLIDVRAQYGFPRNLESSWAKNKSKVFFSIVRRMKQAGLHSNFTLALQTLNDNALKPMGRRNMRVNEWEDLALWLQQEGLDCYAELIWGCPGETYDSFIAGYDKLARHVYRIATYPHLLIPNTEYTAKRNEYGIKAIRGDDDDFEYVLSHETMSIADNRRMLRFLFWARVVAEYMLFRSLWSPLRELDGISQSQVLLSLDNWLDGRDDPVACGLQSCRAEVVDNFDLSRVSTGIHYVASEPGLNEYLQEWWTRDFSNRISPELRDFMSEVFRYDLATRPVFDAANGKPSTASPITDRSTFNGTTFYVRRQQTFRYHVPNLVASIRVGDRPQIVPSKFTTDIYYKTGFVDFVDNHEFYPQYVGKTMRQLQAEAEETPRRISRAITLDPTRDSTLNPLTTTSEYTDAAAKPESATPQAPSMASS